VTDAGMARGASGSSTAGDGSPAPTSDGHRKAYYGKTRAEVAQKLALAIKAQRDGIPVPSDKQTFGQFVDRWIVTVTPVSTSRKTASNYAQLLLSHAVPLIGRVSMTGSGLAIWFGLRSAS